ncbi:MAG: hemerythrin family protein [Magnetococcales bacterium]|nr:hemerythrin family protein [Magnetococcales bacterium]
MNIEAMDKRIWLLVIVPLLVVVAFTMGIEESFLVLILLMPFMLMLKNQFLENKISWKEEYSVGIESIDNDHKQLLDLTLRIFQSLRSARGADKASEVIDELIEYTVTHFAREEGMMRDNGYVNLDEHIEAHNAMRSKMEEFRKNFDDNSNEVSSELLKYLQEWLISHITVTDKLYSEFLIAKGVK